MKLNAQETAMLLAGLRYLQETLDDAPQAILDILTDGGKYEPDADHDFDDLCFKLNCPPLQYKITHNEIVTRQMVVDVPEHLRGDGDAIDYYVRKQH